MYIAEEMGPPWLSPLLAASFSVPCKIHGDFIKSEWNMYCLDCMGCALCSYCLVYHKNHYIVQVLDKSNDFFLFGFSFEFVLLEKTKGLGNGDS